MKRIAFKLLVFLLLGAIINVAVAWGCAAWTHIVYPHNSEATGFGVRVIEHHIPQPPLALTILPTGPYTIKAGVPFLSASAVWRYRKAPINGIPVPETLRPGPSISGFLRNDYARVFPLRPIWPGFAINTIFYAAIVWTLFAVPGYLKRRRRFKRGLCAWCAYPIGTSTTCTECGVTVKPTR